VIIPTGLIGLLLALVLWVVAWRYCMPRLLPLKYRWGGSRLWRDSLIYPALNVVVLAVVVFVSIMLLPLTAWNAAVGIAGLFVAGLVVLVPGVVVFIWRHAFDLGVSNGRAFVAYILVALVANAAYITLAFGYAALIGVI